MVTQNQNLAKTGKKQVDSCVGITQAPRSTPFLPRTCCGRVDVEFVANGKTHTCFLGTLRRSSSPRSSPSCNWGVCICLQPSLDILVMGRPYLLFTAHRCTHRKIITYPSNTINNITPNKQNSFPIYYNME